MPAPTFATDTTWTVTFGLPTATGDTSVSYEFTGTHTELETAVGVMAEKIEEISNLPVSRVSYSKKCIATDRATTSENIGAVVGLLTVTLSDGGKYTFTLPEPESTLREGAVLDQSATFTDFLDLFVGDTSKWRVSDGEYLLSNEYKGVVGGRKRR